MIEAPSLERAIRSHSNNFNVVRLCAASLVVFYHAYGHTHATDPLTQHVAPYSNAGEIAVGAFFMLSGLFVTKSWLADPNVFRFAIRRFARIVPGLFVCLVVTTIIAVVFFSDQGWRGLLHAAPWRFIFENALLHRLKENIPLSEHVIPGVYPALAEKFMNGSLWTLYWEARMYVALAFIGFAAILPPKRWMAGAAVACLVAMQVRPEILTSYIWEFRLFSLFMTGVLIYCLSNKIRIGMRHAIAATAYVIVMHNSSGFFGVALCFITFTLWIGSIQSKRFAHIQRNDYSFGIYIYHWPVMQMVQSVWQPIESIPLLVVTMALAVPAAMLSWHYIEAPAIAFARKLVDRDLPARWRAVETLDMFRPMSFAERGIVKETGFDPK